jgi:hypothetical protein
LVVTPVEDASSPIFIIVLDLPPDWKVYGSAISQGEEHQMTKIVIQYFDGCPNWKHLQTTVETLTSELGMDSTIELQRIETPEDAVKLRFRGSPTLLVDGVDPFADDDAPFGLGCRVYRTDTGISGEPTYDQLRSVMDQSA